ncbi:Protein SDA1 [Entamoeba marina]
MTDYTIIQRQIKTDPSAYEEDFKQYYNYFKVNVTTLLAQADLGMVAPDSGLDEMLRLIVFLNNIAGEYKQHLQDFPRELIDLLKKCKLPSKARVTITKALIGLRGKDFLSLEEVLPTLLEMLTVKDKNVSGVVYRFIINDIKYTSKKKGGAKSKHATMRLLEQIIDSNTNAKVVKKVVQILGELYQRKIMKEPRVINILANAILNQDAKIKQAEMDEDTKETLKQAEEDLRLLKKKMGMKKRTGKLRSMKKEAEDNVAKLRKTEVLEHQPNWGAIDAIYDPNGFCDKLFKDIKASRCRFAVRLMEIDLLSRIIARREVICLPFYSFIVRYLYVRHQNITELLAYTSQAIHSLVPPDVIEPIIRTILNNFISDRSKVEAQALGLNTVRIICERCPLAMNKSMLTDLALYKKSHSKAVISGARSLIALYRNLDPSLLSKKDRGKPNQQKHTIKQYGETTVYDGPVGAELLNNNDEMSEDSDEVEEGNNNNDNELDISVESGEEVDEEVDEEVYEEDMSDEEEEMSNEEYIDVNYDNDNNQMSGDDDDEISNEEDDESNNDMECDDEIEEGEDLIEEINESNGSEVNGILTQEQFDIIRRKQREEQGLDSSDDDEIDTTYVTPESLTPSIQRKMEREERIQKLRESKEESNKFHRERGKTSKVFARNKPFFMKSFSQKALKKQEDRTKQHKSVKVHSGKIRKRFGKSGLRQKSNGGWR